MKKTDIIVLDFGSQYTMLIVRRLRENGIYAELLPFNASIDEIKSKNPSGIILSGGPASVYASDGYFPDDGIFDLGIPILGICYGMQLIAKHFGGDVKPAGSREFGKAELRVLKSHPLFNKTENFQIVWMSHSDKVEKIPDGFEPLADTKASEYCVFGDDNRKIYALQFHPEVAHSEFGARILKNFGKYICGIDSLWNMGTFAKSQISKMSEIIGNDKVICAVSGGVDSSVVVAILANSIPKENLIIIFVDNGLLRLNEAQEVRDMFKARLGIDINFIDASETFLRNLKGVIDPEQKRKIIGKTFIDIFDEAAKKYEGVRFLAQGTLYTDIIESSVAGASKTIKSHHNVGGLPSDLKFELIEPLKEIFKDEVRLLGLELGLPKDILYRHPFPGPGLGIRVIGEVTKEKLDLLRLADKILIDELKASGFYAKTWQAFCVLMGVKSVGVMGDNRTYEDAICIRVVDASDGMTATFSYLPYEILERISRRIINEINGINRVVYDISSKPPATIEWE